MTEYSVEIERLDHPVREFVYRRCIIRADPFGTYSKKCGAVPGDGRKR